MNVFLRKTVQVALNWKDLKEPKLSSIHFVVGNETCDLDSAMSALLYSWFLAKTRTGSCKSHFIPVLNIPASMYRLKTETTHLLKKLEISQKDLIFRDQFDQYFANGINQEKVKITLLDHHMLSKSDEFMRPYLVEVIDHRPRAATFVVQPSVLVDIARVGSCVTLVAERIMKEVENGALQIDDDEWNEISYMISGTIVVDTVNLEKSAGKVTDRDLKVIERFWRGSKSELTRFFEELSTAKSSVVGLTAEELMLKDAKFVESSTGERKVMFSTIHDTSENFWQRNDATTAVPGLLCRRMFHLWVALMPVQPDSGGQPYKPLVLYSEDDTFRTQVEEALTSAQSPVLDLRKSEPLNTEPHYTFFRMCNIKASRKQVLPVVVNLIG